MTIGFYLEESVRRRSAGLAAALLWGEFVAWRYLPVFLLFYLEGRGLRLPWILGHHRPQRR